MTRLAQREGLDEEARGEADFLESPEDETLGHYGVANLFAGPAQGPADAFYGMNATETWLSLGADGMIKYECSRPSGAATVSIYQARIIAIRVGDLH